MINNWLNEHIEQIKTGKIKVFVEDECHLKGGDICGYGWGNRQERLETPVKNYRDSQTYYGAMNCITGEMILRSYSRANSSSTIEFVKESERLCVLVCSADTGAKHRISKFRS